MVKLHQASVKHQIGTHDGMQTRACEEAEHGEIWAHIKFLDQAAPTEKLVRLMALVQAKEYGIVLGIAKQRNIGDLLETVRIRLLREKSKCPTTRRQ